MKLCHGLVTRGPDRPQPEYATLSFIVLIPLTYVTVWTLLVFCGM
jgi:hypothetical protein